jgi:hypothetical protein
LNLSLAIPETTIPSAHFSITHASQILPGPTYPSLYRPPISQA